MFQKPFIIFAIVILVLSPTSTYSAYDLIKKDISEGQNISFYCQSGTSQHCCSQLAHRVSSDHHSRCASIVLMNNSGHNIDLDVVNLEDGRWIVSGDYSGGNDININCQPRSLLDGESETISSVTSHFVGGITGYVNFIIKDDTSSKFNISWKVPTIGSPEYEFSFFNESSYFKKYDVIKNNAFDDTVFQVTINENIEKNHIIICKYY